MLFSNNSSMILFATSFCFGELLYGLKRIGPNPCVSIVCLTRPVLPKSFVANANRLAFSVRRDLSASFCSFGKSGSAASSTAGSTVVFPIVQADILVFATCGVKDTLPSTCISGRVIGLFVSLTATILNSPSSCICETNGSKRRPFGSSGAFVK